MPALNTAPDLKDISLQMNSAARFFRSLGPAIPGGSSTEATRAGFGALIGLGIAGLFVLSPAVDPQLGLYLIAPFGASAVLIFAVPNSPLAQPWSAIVGNILGALIGVVMCLTVPDPTLRIALAVALTISTMILCRAVHPPAGAVAMTAAMNPEIVTELGFRFVLTPVALGTVVLVVIAAFYARLTGRRYPFRHFDDPNTHGTTDPAPLERLGLSESELTDILERYRLSFNLGVEDLARLVGAAEMQAATHHTGPLTAADIMSRDLVTVGPDIAATEVARLFRTHKFSSVPVVASDGLYMGIIFQMHLIAAADQARGAALFRPLGRIGGRPATAADIMDTTSPRATQQTSIAVLLALMSEDEIDSVPVLQDGCIQGIVTQTDMITAFARSSLQSPVPAQPA